MAQTASLIVERESSLEAYFAHRVRSALGGIVIKMVPLVRGTPDRLVMLPGGQLHLVELKTETGNLSPAQMVWHDRARQLGATVYTLRGRPEIVTWLRARAREIDGTAARAASLRRRAPVRSQVVSCSCEHICGA